MTEKRKLAAILAADVVGFSRLAGSDEERTLARLRTLWSDLIAPTISVHNGRAVKRTGDGSIIEFRSVVDAVRCAIGVQNGMVERNAGLPPERRIEFRVGIHLGDVVEESDGDLMGDGVNIAARLEGIAKPGAICLSEQAYWQVKSRLDLAVSDLGAIQLKNIAAPVRVYSLEVGKAAQAKPTKPALRKQWPMRALLGAGDRRADRGRGQRLVFPWREPNFDRRLECTSNEGRSRASFHRGAAFREPLGRSGPGLFRRRHHGEPHDRPLAHPQQLRDRARHRLHFQGQEHPHQGDQQGTGCAICPRRLGAA